MNKEFRVTIPKLGEASVSVGVGFFDIRFGGRYVNTSSEDDVPALVVNGKPYHGYVSINADGRIQDRGLFDRSFVGWHPPFTEAAARKVKAVLEEWATEWVRSPEAVARLSEVVQHHNRLNERIVREELDKARNHVAELELLAEKFRAVDEPTEYVSPWATTYRLESR